MGRQRGGCNAHTETRSAGTFAGRNTIVRRLKIPISGQNWPEMGRPQIGFRNSAKYCVSFRYTMGLREKNHEKHCCQAEPLTVIRFLPHSSACGMHKLHQEGGAAKTLAFPPVRYQSGSA